MSSKTDITVIGAGLAGSEAAYRIAENGFKVTLVEMRPTKFTPVHITGNFAELVCSNSLKAESIDVSSGLLKKELELLGSLLIKTAYLCKVPAGGALAVNRDAFAQKISEILSNHKNITIERREALDIPDTPAIIATGPLTSDLFAEKLKEYCGGGLYFADAIAPILSAESIDMSKGYFLGRYGKGGDDYFNIPFTKEEYDSFYDDLMTAEKKAFHGFEKIDYFEGCMPVEVMAERGRQTLTFGPMKPVGLEDPKSGIRPYAVMQLRKENIDGTAFNIVGFQTKMTVPAQKKVFGNIAALKNADFLRFGAVHRNTYIDSPSNLDRYFQFKKSPGLFMAGQVTGLEGYVESISGGLMAGIQAVKYLRGESFIDFPETTALGALARFVCGESGLARAQSGDYSPSNFHFGMFAPIADKLRDKKLKKELLAKRALEGIGLLLKEL